MCAHLYARVRAHTHIHMPCTPRDLYACGHPDVLSHTCTCGSQREMLNIFVYLNPPYFSGEKGSHWTISARLTSQEALGIQLYTPSFSPPTQGWGYRSGLPCSLLHRLGIKRRSSCTASTSLTVAPSQPNFFNLLLPSFYLVLFYPLFQKLKIWMFYGVRVHASAHGDRKVTLNSLELELYPFVSCPVWVLGSELWPSGRGVSAPNYCAISSATRWVLLIRILRVAHVMRIHLSQEAHHPACQVLLCAQVITSREEVNSPFTLKEWEQKLSRQQHIIT